MGRLLISDALATGEKKFEFLVLAAVPQFKFKFRFMFAKFYPVSMIRFIEMFDLFLFPLALA